MTDFFRFPHTPHIAWLGSGTPRDDKVLSRAEAEELLAWPVVLEEKLDGANLGFSVSQEGELRAQNRGQYLNSTHGGQFTRLSGWLAPREGDLFDALGTDLIAFGEWCAARHSLDYQSLPDWWLLFDIYDKRAGRFWSTKRRNQWAQELGLVTVPRLDQGHFGLVTLANRLASARSAYRNGAMEGMVIRLDGAEWLEQCAKLVRADFAQAIQSHWRHQTLAWNRIERQVS